MATLDVTLRGRDHRAALQQVGSCRVIHRRNNGTLTVTLTRTNTVMTRCTNFTTIHSRLTPAVSRVLDPTPAAINACRWPTDS
jgi:hypothetical protein